MIIIQVEYVYKDGAHWWFGRDRLSNGVLVGNKDYDVSYREVVRQLNSSIKTYDVSGDIVCTLDPDKLKAAAEEHKHMIVVWKVENARF